MGYGIVIDKTESSLSSEGGKRDRERASWEKPVLQRLAFDKAANNMKMAGNDGHPNMS
jgi:hypothetical protein